MMQIFTGFFIHGECARSSGTYLWLTKWNFESSLRHRMWKFVGDILVNVTTQSVSDSLSKSVGQWSNHGRINCSKSCRTYFVILFLSFASDTLDDTLIRRGLWVLKTALREASLFYLDCSKSTDLFSLIARLLVNIDNDWRFSGFPRSLRHEACKAGRALAAMLQERYHGRKSCCRRREWCHREIWTEPELRNKE